MDSLIFLHMTKTAGGSIKQSLEAAGDDRFLFRNFADNSGVAESGYAGRGGEYKLIFGHSIYGIHESLGLTPNYGVFLREPIARVVSHFYHLRNVDKGRVGDMIRSHASIAHFFRDDFHWEFSNFMCRVVSGVGPKRIDEQELFELAKAKLDSFRFVGFLEYLGYSLGCLGALLDHDFGDLGVVNQGRYGKREASPETMKKIFDLNLQDRKLYEYALRTQLPKVISGYYFGYS